ncbi:MAG: hypothetical protein ABI472_15225 [Ginsengibacter sp.]
MKRIKLTFCLIMAVVLLNACTKEYSLETGGLTAPTGTWQFNDSLALFAGNMDSAYIDFSSANNTKELQLIGTSLDGSQNFHMHLFADAFKTGTYKASLFQSSFEYTTTAKTLYQADQFVGEFTVTITSYGSNLVAGTFSGSVIDSANKIKQITLGKFTSTFSPNGNTGNVSAGVLGDSSGNCKPVTLAGTYTQGIALTAANTAQVQVTVASVGTYSIATNTINGVNFSKTGTFTSTGVQTISLTGSGTPLNAGLQNFSVTFGTSACSFGITFLAGVIPSGDYFPLTLNSNWTYDLQGGTAADAVHSAVISYAPTFGGNSYTTIAAYDVPPAQAFDSAYYRKPGGDYYQYALFSNSIPFDQAVAGEFIFLKDNVPSGTSWSSPDISGTVNGVPITATIQMTITAKSVPVTIGTFTFPDVIKVKYEYFIKGNPVVLQTAERWFAKNDGEVYNSISDGTRTSAYNISAFTIL